MNTLIISALKSALQSAGLLRTDVLLLAAVSGGADSVALLHGLHLLQSQVPYRLAAVHVEHGLREDSSQQDALFVQNLCETLHIPLFLYHANLQGGMNSAAAEVRARTARQQFFRTALTDCKADALLVAHHRDDQAETVLMRLLRGAGAKGLAAMCVAGPFADALLLRPFLGLPRTALSDALRREGLTWREDESNAEPCSLRNRLRLCVMPLLEEYRPQAAAHMAQAAERLAWDEDCLHALAKDALKNAAVSVLPCCTLDCSALMASPKAVVLRSLRLWYEQGMACAMRSADIEHDDSIPPAPLPSAANVERSLSHTDSVHLYHLLQSDCTGSLNLPHALRAERTSHYLHLLHENGSPIPPCAPHLQQRIQSAQQDYRLGAIRFTLLPAQDSALPTNACTLPLSSALLAKGLLLRCPLPGDMIHPFGAKGKKPLRRYFTDRKVDRPFRATWPVLACGQDILWVAGIGAAEETRLSNPQNAPLLLRLVGSLPYKNTFSAGFQNK